MLLLVSDLLDRIRRELDERIAVLRPAVAESARLQRAADALDQSDSPAASAPAAASASNVRRAARPGGRATPVRRRRSARAGTERAAPGQTRLRVIAQLQRDPGSTSTAVAKALGISANAAAATISRLVKQGRVRRLQTGGYAAAPAPEEGSATVQPSTPTPDSSA